MSKQNKIIWIFYLVKIERGGKNNSNQNTLTLDSGETCEDKKDQVEERNQ